MATESNTPDRGSAEEGSQEVGFISHRCKSCKGVAHPASGCVYAEDYIICGRCTREAWRWVRGHTNIDKRVGPKGSKRRVSFYEAAGKNRPIDNGV